MAEHKQEVLRCARLNLPPTRDTFIMAHDVHNLAHSIAKELWELHGTDAESVRMWTESNTDA